MSNRGKYLRAGLFSMALPLAACLCAPAAFASDSLPGDGIAPPVNVNIGMLYNIFTNAGGIGDIHGGSYNQNTHISMDIVVGRYIRTFDINGILSGVQFYVPYAGFLGGQEAGIANIPGPYVPALGGQLPSYGPGRANLSHNSGFGQPYFGVFSYVLNHPASGTYGVIAPWIAPPLATFSRGANLNPGQNTWTYELELGFRTVLWGTPSTPNLAVELWSESYVFGANAQSAYVSPEVSANNIPAIYNTYNALSGGAIPNTNPLQSSQVIPASFHEQPSQEFRIYLPYEFAPSMGAFIAPGFFQSFGGKQTYNLQGGGTLDSGNRTNETQLRLIGSTFLSPTLQIMAIGEYDLASHGGPLNRNVEIRLATFF
ncbi:hypothetical protein GCM10010909_23000 [Acidocella aquatica]|uniref:Phenol degradation protein meta n=1 Tax=Acidocella aquatica TaxID=1922313 RepID=A0ABQ6ABZ7_9PROT|nr:transporter [Acidocella aquatica]GLR67619.1 hypothetical protein GCM10010909_23000 [Acidocella aquatica]